MIWFFTLVLMINGHLPVVNETYTFQTEQACIEEQNTTVAQLAHAGQGYLVTVCESR